LIGVCQEVTFALEQRGSRMDSETLGGGRDAQSELDAWLAG
jgi:hypothetical protein